MTCLLNIFRTVFFMTKKRTRTRLMRVEILVQSQLWPFLPPAGLSSQRWIWARTLEPDRRSTSDSPGEFNRELRSQPRQTKTLRRNISPRSHKNCSKTYLLIKYRHRFLTSCCFKTQMLPMNLFTGGISQKEELFQFFVAPNYLKHIVVSHQSNISKNQQCL